MIAARAKFPVVGEEKGVTAGLQRLLTIFGRP